MSSTNTSTTTEHQDEVPSHRQIGSSLDVSSYGIDYMRAQTLSRRPSLNSLASDDYTLASGMATPDPLLGTPAASRAPSRRRSMIVEADHEVMEMQNLHTTTSRMHGHMGDAFENLSRALTNTSAADEANLELRPTMSHRTRRLTPAITDGKRPYDQPSSSEEEGKPTGPRKQQGVPPELRNLTAESFSSVSVLLDSCCSHSSWEMSMSISNLSSWHWDCNKERYHGLQVRS